MVATWCWLYLLTWISLVRAEALRSELDGPCQTNLARGTKEGYTSNEEIGKLFFQLNDKYPQFTNVFSIGNSIKGQAVWVLEISLTPGKPDKPKPNMKYIGNLHGDEVIGRQLLVMFAKYVLNQLAPSNSVRGGSGPDPLIVSLLSRTNLFIAPTVNPDGYDLMTRSNAAGVDLNRNFPDQFKQGRTLLQQETINIINWMSTGRVFDRQGEEITLHYRFALSANFHGGDLVVNYPFDGTGNDNKNGITPDDQLFRSLATSYAKENSRILNNPDFKGTGITNGVAWYPLWGGMQDWNYVWYGCMETTLEVSCNKWPTFSLMNDFWNDNLQSLKEYWSQIDSGVGGNVLDEDGNPVNATVVSSGSPFKVYTQNGFYWRLLVPGEYTLTASASGFRSSSVDVFFDGTAIRDLHFTLKRDAPKNKEPPTKEKPLPTPTKPKNIKPPVGESPPLPEDNDILPFLVIVVILVLFFLARAYRGRKRTILVVTEQDLDTVVAHA